MKRSRIICSIITVIYVLLSVALILLLAKSNMSVKSSVPTYVKAVFVALFGASLIMYIWIKKRLAKKLSNKSLSITISRIYYYVYLAVIVFVSRVVMAYVLRDDVIQQIVPSFNMGLGSYINYGLAFVINNQMYANVFINAVLAFISCVIIKKILLNITENDTVATIASIMYLFIPQSLVYVTQYVRYSYNALLVLSGILVFTKIIDEVKNFSNSNKKYLIYSIVLGVISSLDIILGSSYVLWCIMLIVTTLAAMYVDTTHVHIKFKDKLSYKLKRIVEKIEKVNISKLIYVCIIVLLISGITTLLHGLLSSANNYQIFNVENSVEVLRHSRTYYLVIIIFALVFKIIGVILKRKLDIKMFSIKVGMIASGILTFFMIDGIYASAIFDTLLVLTVVINICNICYNREERIKLLKDKN